MSFLVGLLHLMKEIKSPLKAKYLQEFLSHLLSLSEEEVTRNPQYAEIFGLAFDLFTPLLASELKPSDELFKLLLKAFKHEKQGFLLLLLLGILDDLKIA